MAAPLDSRFRRKACAALLAACVWSAPAGADQMLATEGAPARAQLDFRIVIPEVIRMRVVDQPARLVISDDDIRKGYVEAPCRVEIVSNGAAGFALTVTLTEGAVSGGRVTGLAGELPLSMLGAGLRMTHRNRADKRVLYDLRYRFIVNQGVSPGEYRWPVFLQISA